MKKFTALLLIFSLMAISCTTIITQRQKRFESSKERKHGAELDVWKKSGWLVTGELIAVKPNSLLLLNPQGKDVSVDIADIKVIRIVKKSKALLGAGIGGGAGALATIIFVALTPLREEPLEYKFNVAVVGGAYGAILGALLGLVAGKDKTIQIEGMTESEIQETLDKLRKKARIRDYR